VGVLTCGYALGASCLSSLSSVMCVCLSSVMSKTRQTHAYVSHLSCAYVCHGSVLSYSSHPSCHSCDMSLMSCHSCPVSLVSYSTPLTLTTSFVGNAHVMLPHTQVGVTPRNNAMLECLLLPLLAVVQLVFLRFAMSHACLSSLALPVAP